MNANTILEVTRTLIGSTEPCGDSAIDREHTENLNALIYVIDELLNDICRIDAAKYRNEGSMQAMGEKAEKALKKWRRWIDGWLEW